MSRIERSRYRNLYGPTTGDRIRLADTDLLIEVTEDRSAGAAAGDEVVFGGGKVIRESMGQSTRTRADGAPDLVITGAVILDHWGIVKADVGVKDGRIVGIGKAGNPDTMDGIDPALDHRPVDRDPRRQRQDPHGRCHRLPRAPDLADAARRGAHVGHHHDHRWRHRAGRRHQGHDRVGLVVPGTDARSPRPLADQRRPDGQGQHGQPRGHVGAAAFGRCGVQAARGLGHHAGCDRRVSHRRRRLGRAGGDPHRHPQRGRVRREHARGHRRPLDPHVPHRRRRRRACARHHDGRVAPERAAVVDQPDPAPHRQHGGRTPRHVDGLPPPQPVGARGSRVRRESYPTIDDRRRGHPPRHGCDLDDRLGQPGDGSHRRGRAAHLADGARDEAASRHTARGAVTGRRQRPRHGATSPNTRSVRRSRTGSLATSARSRSASSPTWCCTTRRSSVSVRTWWSRRG